MGYFDVGDGEGGTPEDRIAIICIVAFAFCWIPIFMIWKCITLVRRKDSDAEAGNAPVTTRNSDPEKNPYHPEPLPIQHREGPEYTREEERRASGDEQRRASKDDRSQASRDVERRASRNDHGRGVQDVSDTIGHPNTLDSGRAAQRSDSREAGRPLCSQSSHQVIEVPFRDVHL